MTPFILESLQVILVTLVLISLSAYSFLALYELVKEKSLTSTLLIEHMFSFSLLWLTESLVIVSFYVYFLPIQTNIVTINLLLPIASITLVILLGVAYYFWKKKPLSLALRVTMLSINSCLALTLLFKLPTLLILKLTILVYMLIFIAYTYFSYKITNKVSLIRIFYTAFCILIILIVNLLENHIPLNLYLTVNLCLCFFLMISFSLYHAQIYTSKLVHTTKDADSKKNELIEAEKRIQYLAYTHPDTQLKNAHKLHVDLKNNAYNLTGICMLNIKNFKLLLTLIGYRESKAILEDISKALITYLGTSEDLYHFSTDRFIVLYKKEPDDFEDFIQGMISLFLKNNLCAIDLNPCIGATYVKDLSFNYDILIQELELSSHIAKHTISRYTLYVSDMSITLQDTLELESKLKEATKCDDWEIYFQPKVNVLNNQIMGAEALIRWRGHETTITPNTFIPLAEKLGLINQIGRYVIATTFKYVHELDTMGFKGLKFSINLSVQQLIELDLVAFIQEMTAKYCISPSHIIFEITESIFIHNMTKVNITVTQLKYLGFRFSLDDFGTGYSSLAYLSKLNFDELKFDREFIKNIKLEEKNLIILECVTKMGQNLGLEIVTEGIENELQYNTIKSFGCDYYQGYYFSRPVPFDNFLSLLTAPVASR